MSSLDLKPKSTAEIDHRKAVLSLRWLLVILASYLTLFSYVGTRLFAVAFGIGAAFAVTNVILMLIPRSRFIDDNVQRAVAVIDVIFVGATLYLLRAPQNYLYAVFILIFILAVVWRDLRLVLFSLLVVSVLFGTFSYFRLFQLQLAVTIEQFLALALFFEIGRASCRERV